ncbi:LicD family protein [Limosilactobacillus reuteri]|uniref:LicD family protein n=1 Tax=Limosilactobacillus reuteri TaxID=1598 RepID=UPI00143DC60A|nr:LicD family protein [Limosilactobacillus reuteri]QIZ04498.1 LicD family protein [Limosilactobacillus reuteri]
MNEVPQKEIRLVSINIFKKVLSICDKLEINVWIMYGTLIGAARHKGFIPWDDDFDIAMKRSDYTKFIDYCINNPESIAPYYIDNCLTNFEFPYYITRICDPNYLLKFDNVDYTSGVFIDLYPFDGMGNNLEYWKAKVRNKEIYLKTGIKGNKYRSRIELLKFLLWGHNLINPFVGKNKVAKLIRGTLSIYAKKKSNRYWVERLDSIAKKFTWEESEYVAPVAWDDKVRGIKRSWFEKTKWLEFESIRVPVPGEYKKVLKELYGNYMTLPPEERRKPTHSYIAYRKNDKKTGM